MARSIEKKPPMGPITAMVTAGSLGAGIGVLPCILLRICFPEADGLMLNPYLNSGLYSMILAAASVLLLMAALAQLILLGRTGRGKEPGKPIKILLTCAYSLLFLAGTGLCVFSGGVFMYPAVAYTACSAIVLSLWVLILAGNMYGSWNRRVRRGTVIRILVCAAVLTGGLITAGLLTPYCADYISLKYTEGAEKRACSLMDIKTEEDISGNGRMLSRAFDEHTDALNGYISAGDYTNGEEYFTKEYYGMLSETRTKALMTACWKRTICRMLFPDVFERKPYGAGQTAERYMIEADRGYREYILDDCTGCLNERLDLLNGILKGQDRSLDSGMLETGWAEAKENAVKDIIVYLHGKEMQKTLHGRYGNSYIISVMENLLPKEEPEDTENDTDN